MSCSNSKKSDTLQSELNTKSQFQVEKRFLYEFFVDSLQKEMEYELTKKIKDSSIIYNYKNLNDDEKNMSFKFVKNTNQLFFVGTEFELIKKDHYTDKALSELKFDLYVMTESVDDGNGPMFFNPEYGILNLDNGWGMNFLYLKTGQQAQLAEKLNEILKEKTSYNNVYN